MEILVEYLFSYFSENVVAYILMLTVVLYLILELFKVIINDVPKKYVPFVSLLISLLLVFITNGIFVEELKIVEVIFYGVVISSISTYVYEIFKKVKLDKSEK